jgi:iron(III) transport system ATP-binding protein
VQMRVELKRLQRELGITAVYVTHDQVEALGMSSKIAVMNDGEIQQVGRPRDVYERPCSRFVADFIGSSNFIDGVVDRHEPDDRYVIDTPHGKLIAKSTASYAPGSPIVVAARPEQISIDVGTANGTGPNRWQGTVGTRAFLGEAVDHMVAVGDRELRVRSNPSVSIPPGSTVSLVFSEEACSLIPPGD